MHSIACLEYANEQAIRQFRELNVPLYEDMASNTVSLQRGVEQSDIIIIHWWNHPLLMNFLVNCELPPARVLLWSHVSGHAPPQVVTEAILSYPDLFVASTPFTLEIPLVKAHALQQNRVQPRIILDCAGFERVSSVCPKPHEGFRIGYVGTVDYCKMHRNFILMNGQADIPDAHFIVCGGPHDALLRSEAEGHGLGHKFSFLGHVEDIPGVLGELDVFGYPLAPWHYGTGEQALIEALAAGIPAVVMDNGAEKHIVEDGITGIIAGSDDAYTNALEFLRNNPEQRLAMAQQARKSARQRFTIENTAALWSQLFYEAMDLPKRARSWQDSCLKNEPLTPAEVFCAALGPFKKRFIQSLDDISQHNSLPCGERGTDLFEQYQASTRGTPFHYQSFFPGDPCLNYWCGILSMERGNREQSRHYFSLAKDRGIADVDSKMFERSHWERRWTM